MENTDGYKIHEKLLPVKSMNNDPKTDAKLPDNELNTLKGNFGNLTDAENQTNNINKNRCIKINKIDHNVVIDDAKQSPQQLQQQQQQQQPLKSYGCKHYKRQAKFVVSRTQKFSFILRCLFSAPFIFFIEKLFQIPNDICCYRAHLSFKMLDSQCVVDIV